MEEIYRGYPQTLQMWYQQEEPEPDEPFWDIRRRSRDEWNYFRGLYPMEAKRLQRVAEEEFDRIDREGGPMYDEYPDREFIYRVRELMLVKALAEGLEADRDLMQVVMLHELFRRRMERIRK